MVYFIAFYLFLIISYGVLRIKNDLTKEIHLMLLHAIHVYNIDQLRNGSNADLIDYDVLEDYDKTLWRLWDWGFKNIVPSDVLEKIEPFIGREETTQ